LALMLWPLAPTVGAINSTPAMREWVMASSSGPLWVTVSSVGALAVGLWWMCLGLVLRRYPAAVRATFRPAGDWFERRHATRIALGGLLLAGAAGSMLATVLA
jgi:hypothetical protein